MNKESRLSKFLGSTERAPQIELSGFSTVYIDNCESIIEYREETVKLKFNKRYVRLYGKNLLISDIKGTSLVISGELESMEFNG